MKLAELAHRTGASKAAIKYWIREGVLPPGRLRNQTTAVYDERHVERVALIQTMRAEFDASIERIRDLTALIDASGTPVVDVMQACQLIATGLAADEEPPAWFAQQVDELNRRAGWPQVDSVAARALAAALAASARGGFVYELDQLAEYARGLAPLADGDIDSIRPDATLDVMARNLLIGAATQNRMFAALNQLAHTSAAVRRMSGEGAGAPGAGGE